jgi:hypothetical protein
VTEDRARPRGFARSHWLFLAVLLLGAALRMCAFIAYQPAILYVDSFRYLDNLFALDPTQLDPIGYDLILRVLVHLGGLRGVTGIQHLAGLGIGVAVYALALRNGARHWLAAIAAAPILLDAYQVQIEQNVMSDVWLEVLLIAVLWVIAARGTPTPGRAAIAGLLLGSAAIVRTIAVPLALPLLGYLVIAGGAWRSRSGWAVIATRAAAMLTCFGVVLFCYAGYFHRETGQWGFAGAASGDVVYGRTANVADCAELRVSADLAQLCPPEPLGQRKGVDFYAHLVGEPGWPAFLPAGSTLQDLQRRFAITVIEQQPGAVAGGILDDFAKGFEPGRDSQPSDVPVQRWQFQTFYPLWSIDETQVWHAAIRYGGEDPMVNNGVAAFLRDYQLHGGYTPGPLEAIFAVFGLIGGFGFARRQAGVRAITLLATGFGLVLLFASAMFEFSWRYQLPGLVLLPLGGVLGMTVLMGPLKRPATKSRRSMLSAFPDQVDWSAMNDFTDRHGAPDFKPVLVVIAAYNEEGGIGGVLDNLPKECCGLPVDVLVVVDGCSDDTARVAAEHGAYTCVAPTNRGQGSALRLGYHMAAMGGADYVITTDADGQYENDEMPMLLRPILDNEADFTTGSRRLGVAPGDDRVRWLGVRVYATLASILSARRITDTSFGFRGMRTSLACSVELQQPQYQASELLISVLASGARLLELPMTMRVRSAGTTKKGNNFVYGMRYGKVMTRTWFREYVLRRVTRRPVPGASASSVDQAA